MEAAGEPVVHLPGVAAAGHQMLAAQVAGRIQEHLLAHHLVGVAEGQTMAGAEEQRTGVAEARTKGAAGPYQPEAVQTWRRLDPRGHQSEEEVPTHRQPRREQGYSKAYLGP